MTVMCNYCEAIYTLTSRAWRMLVCPQCDHYIPHPDDAPMAPWITVA